MNKQINKISHETVFDPVTSIEGEIFLIMPLALLLQLATFSLESCCLTSLVHLLMSSISHHGNREITVHQWSEVETHLLFLLCYLG